MKPPEVLNWSMNNEGVAWEPITKTPFEVGEPARLYIPNPDDYDHEYHGKTGVVKSVRTDDFSGNHELDSHLYTIRFDDGTLCPARHSDLRPETPQY